MNLRGQELTDEIAHPRGTGAVELVELHRLHCSRRGIVEIHVVQLVLK